MRWDRVISRPDWYLTVIPEAKLLLRQCDGLQEAERTAVKQALYDYFETHLAQQAFALGQGNHGADSERKDIDTIVIHHTSNPPGLSPMRLSAIELLRLYGPYFAAPPPGHEHLKGAPIVSGHERNGRQIFWPYHWLIRNDGRAERLLFDHEIGWHAGDWNTNCRSIAIALDNDHESSRPTDLVLQAVATLIASHYRQVPSTRVLGHREVNPNTTCPSESYLKSGAGKGWKFDLIDALSRCLGESG